MTPIEAAITWIQNGFSPVPVPHRSKRPVLQGWQQLEITIESASRFFNGHQQNIGLHMGDKYGSADVDCDCHEAITAARLLLPETGMIFGRQSKPFSHHLYRADPPVRTEQFCDPLDHQTLIELRGLKTDGTIGLQTVVPPSTHESGELIRFEQGFHGLPANVVCLPMLTLMSSWQPSVESLPSRGSLFQPAGAGASLDRIRIGAAASAGQVVIRLDGPATMALLRGEAVQAIAQNPRTVQSANLSATRANAGRRELLSLQMSPGLLTT